ncbi:MAG: uroporphyrinogen decarboxylase family protein, partial [Oscillospiraceae bacterium]
MKTKRDNLLSLLRKEGYEQAPWEFALCPSLEADYHRTEHTDEDYMQHFEMPWRRLPDLCPDDDDRSRFLPYHSPEDHITLEELDEWGIGHRATPTSMHMTQMFCPLRSDDSEEGAREYPLPTYSAKNNAHLKEQVAALHASGIASVGNMQCTIWETSWYIRGMENLMMDMMTEEESAEILLDRVTEMSIQRAQLYTAAGVDILYLGDDVGMQQSIMMSEALYTAWIKPRLKRVIDAARAINPKVIVFYHTCGYVEPLIPHFIDAGIDVLNPVQPECMDFERIFKLFGDKLSFHGTIGTQSTMPFGTPAEVQEQVRRNLTIAGEKGGLFVAPTHLLEPEVPWENIRAYVAACRDYQGEN